jgi:molybdate transport system substrate-binding protein
VKRFLPLLASLSVVLAACGGFSETARSETSDGVNCPTGTPTALTILAASSLANAFNEAKEKFLVNQPCVSDITFSFGSSSTLATQIMNGSPADVFVAASQTAMETVTAAGVNDGEPTVFSYNRGEIMISGKSDFVNSVSNVAEMRDSVNKGIRVGLCVSSAPCGSIADKIIEKSRKISKASDLVRAAFVDTEAASAEELVTKIEIGELDAGIVYHSDCFSSERKGLVQCREIPLSLNATTEYAAVALKKSAGAQIFIQFLLSKEVQTLLNEKYGFYNYDQ